MSETASVPVQGNARETWLVLLVLGAVICLSMTTQLLWPTYDSKVIEVARVTGPLTDWTTAMSLTVAFVVLWLGLRGGVAKDAGRSAVGFAVAALIGVVLT